MVDYLGAEDSELTRAMTRKVFTAAVARIEQPGTKFDYVMTLVGPEGIGKSTIIRNMGRQWYSDSLITIEGKEGMEAVQGKWLIEIGELTSYKKSTAEMYKAFLSKQEDVFRPAFARSVEIYPRQCVFFATTNEDYFLKGDTGNRRWWCVTVGVNTPTKDVWAMTDETIGQIWAEAKHRYAQGEKLYLDERLEVAARKRQAENNEVEGDERKGMIQAFLMKPVPAAWPIMPPEARRQYILSADLLTPEGTEMREYVCATEILVECFGEKIDGMTKYKTREINAMLRSLGLKETGLLRNAGPYGRQRYYDVKKWLENVGADE
jgi:predicted P-loop ATPase